MTDRLWEIAQGRFGARSMRACLESPYITIHQQVSECKVVERDVLTPCCSDVLQLQ